MTSSSHPSPALHNLGLLLTRNGRENLGVYLMQDIHASTDVRGNMDHPLGPSLHTIPVMHCMTVSLTQGGAGLGTTWGREQALAMLQEAGFGGVEIHRPDHDLQNDYDVVRKAAA